MKIVLATPPFDLFRKGYGSRKAIKRGHMPPLGVGYLAAVLGNNGDGVRIVDSSASGYSTQEARDEILKDSPDVVGISALTAAAEEAFQLADAIKEKESKTIVILGGPHATCFPEEIMAACKSIDITVMGEGEEIIISLTNAIKNNLSLANVESISYRNNAGEVIINPNRKPILDLDQIPMPARHLYRHNLYSPLPYSYKKLPSTSMITSRGCPYSKCAFCYSAGRMGQRYRRHSPPRIIDEIEMVVKKYGMKEVVFFDDNFIVHEHWIEEFCKKLKESKLNIAWTCAARVDTVTKKSLQLVAEVGCWTVYYGLESGVQKLLDIINKGITLEQSRNAVKWTYEAGMESRGSFMLALPGETPQLGQKTIDFSIELDLTYAQFTPTHPEPGTKLYDLALSKGKLEKFRSKTKATYVPDGYKSKEEVENTVRRAYRQFYFRPRYFLKHLKTIRSINDIKRYYDGFLFLTGLT